MMMSILPWESRSNMSFCSSFDLNLEMTSMLTGNGARSLFEGVVVLLCEQGGRDEDCGLTAVLYRFEGAPESDLRLAETYVAADDAIHRIVALHVLFDVLERGYLVGCFFEREARFENLLPRSVRIGLDFPAPTCVRRRCSAVHWRRFRWRVWRVAWQNATLEFQV